MTLESDLRALLHEGQRERVFEQASVAVYRSGQLLVSVGTHDPDAVFDVASVTKVATAVLALKNWPAEQLSTPRRLLSHDTGLPAWRPFFAIAAQHFGVSVVDLITDASLHSRTRQLALEYIATVVAPTAPHPTYSDLNFIQLRESLVRMERWDFERDLKSPLDLRSMQWGGEHSTAVRTGHLRPRPGNPVVQPAHARPAGFTQDEDLVRIEEEPLPVPAAVISDDHAVDDDNAAAMGGLSGHSGLWSNARDLAKLGDALRRCAEGEADLPLPPERARLLFERACGSRTYGLDTPSGETPALGSILGKGPKGAAGHLGFTGCSLWMDRDAEFTVAFLSNAVIIDRPNPRLKTFRPRVHDLIASRLAT
jgi:CubicO group peptidase (beta-lactamase class C family)